MSGTFEATTAVEDVLRVLVPRRQEPGRWEGDCAGAEGGVVFGGQLIGQAIVIATGETAGKAVTSIQTTFARTGDPSRPITFEVDPLHEGRSLASLAVTARQDERRLARSLVLLGAPDADVIRHADPAPDGDGPERAFAQQPLLAGWEQRYAEDVDLHEPVAVGPPELRVWSRFHTDRTEPELARALLAWASVSTFIGVAMRPHAGVGLSMAHRTVSTGVLSHYLAFHEEFAPGEWLLQVLRSPFAGGGRGFGSGQVFTRGGRLVASVAQESLIRPMTVPGSAL
jgi:acyl-CoA thioesterase-2